MKVSIHQPEYLPWLGFFNKIYRSDVYVILDTAKFSHGDFHNRNRIKTKNGSLWLTVPISGSKMLPIDQTKINHSTNWRKKHWQSISQNYRRAPYFQNISTLLKNLYSSQKFEKLLDLNLTINNCLKDYLGLNTKTVLASSLNLSGSQNDLLINICRQLGADTYLSGSGGKNYLDEIKFTAAGIKVEYQNFAHPEYNQLFKKFIPYMSTIDAVANVGRDETIKLIHQ